MPLFKDIKHSGHAALVGYTLEEDGGKFLDKSPIGTGRADYDDYTVLIVLHFSKSDIGKQTWGWEPN
jgi:hypothetical protein